MLFLKLNFVYRIRFHRSKLHECVLKQVNLVWIMKKNLG